MSSFRLCILGSLLALIVAAGAAHASPPAPQGLVLWNTLGSADEVTHSAYGPNLAFFNCAEFGCGLDVPGTFGYGAGVSGSAAGITGGPYFSGARVHAAVLRQSILDPERGTIEAWYRQTSDPVPYAHNPHRIFGGPYSITGIDEANLFSQDRLDNGDPRLHFSLFFGVEPPPFTPAHLVAVRSLADGGEGYRISALNGTWIHVAGVWDRTGIAGTRDTIRLYVNGEVVAATQDSSWGTTTCDRRLTGVNRCFTDVAGCNDTCADTFAVDELKIWNYAKTDFDDGVRNHRPPGPQPRDRFTQIDVPGALAMTQAFGVNSAGDVAGTYFDARGTHGFVARRGTYTTIDEPESVFGTRVFGINLQGDLAGSYTGCPIPVPVCPFGRTFGFVLHDGVYTKIEHPGAFHTQARGINLAGDVVGSYSDATGSHGYLLHDGEFTTIDHPNSSLTNALGVNGLGDVVGTYLDATGIHGYVLHRGVFSDVDVPGAVAGTTPVGINDQGDIVGNFRAADGQHGFLLQRGSYTVIDHPDATTFTVALGIDERGDVAGTYADGPTQHGFVLNR